MDKSYRYNVIQKKLEKTQKSTCSTIPSLQSTQVDIPKWLKVRRELAFGGIWGEVGKTGSGNWRPGYCLFLGISAGCVGMFNEGKYIDLNLSKICTIQYPYCSSKKTSKYIEKKEKGMPPTFQVCFFYVNKKIQKNVSQKKKFNLTS